MYEGGLGIDDLVQMGMHNDDIRAMEYSNNVVADAVHQQTELLQHPTQDVTISLISSNNVEAFYLAEIARQPYASSHSTYHSRSDEDSMIKWIIIAWIVLAIIIGIGVAV